MSAIPSTYLSTAVGGRATKVRRRFTPLRNFHLVGARGLVREFSRKSRRRLQQTLCAMPVRHVAAGVLFITLTYPADYPGEWQTWKRQLNAWFDRLRRKLPRAAAVWKLEPQKRGAPHFHLLVVGTPFLAKDWLSRSWYDVVGSHDVRHLAAGTQVQLARSHRGVLAYAAKYTSKAQELPPDWQGGVGRWWGVHNRAGLDIQWEVMPVPADSYDSIVRVFRRLIRSRHRDQPRAPPHEYRYGTWVVMSDAAAARVWKWADAKATDAGLVPYLPTAAPSDKGKGR